MKSELIATDGPVDARPNERNLQAKRMRVAGKTATHEQFLNQVVRSERPGREVHTDGFLSLSHVAAAPAYECPKCGFAGLFRSPLCARCEHKLTDALTEGGPSDE